MDSFLAKIIRQYKGDELRRLTMLFALVVMSIGTLLSYVFATTLMQSAERDFSMATEQRVSTLSGHIRTSMDRYRQLLYSGAGVFDVKGTVSQEDWQQFVLSSRVVEQYPSLLGIGYATYNRDQTGGVTTAIKYLEPDNAVNQRAIGYDMYTEARRRAAMEQARDDASVAISEPVSLVQDADNPNKKGVLIYYPVYDLSAPHGTIEQRRSAIRGYVYIALRPSDVVAIIDRETIDLDTLDYKVQDTGNSVVMDSQTAKHDAADMATVRDKDIALYSRVWRVSVTAYHPIWDRYTVPGMILLLGIGFSMAAAMGVYWLVKKTALRLTSTHQQQLMQTRDELLALTSHQLRTPASGVKQYLGMLTQGFMGDLSPEQQAVAEKAYAANERQIETINQILHVAKADAGQLKIDLRRIDCDTLVRSIVDDMAADARRKDIRLCVSSRPGVYVMGDERYIRMVIENLVSNAIKYSYMSSTVDIRVKTIKKMAHITVADKGVGIDAADYDKLFIKFSRVTNDLSAKEGGTGLGLYLARQIMRAHHGRIELDSAIGKGSTFRCIIPLASQQLRKKGDI